MLDAGSALCERLDAALLRMRKLRCEDFERRPGDAATNLPIAVVHVEIHIVGHELVVARVGCGRQWHGSLARLRRCSPEDYPRELLVTFFYYKPPLILNSLRESIKMDISAYPPFAIGLLIAALANLLLYFCSPAGQPTTNTRRVAGLTLLCAAFSIPQLLIVWALPNTAAELFFFCVFGAGLALGTAVAAGARPHRDQG
jgi:hypothetical protein